MKNIKKGFNAKAFNQFITALESKEEFVCPVKGACLMKDAQPGSCMAVTGNDCNTVMNCGEVSSTGVCSIVSTGGGCACHVPSDSSHETNNSVNSSSSTPISSGVSDSCSGVYAAPGTCNWHTYNPGDEHYDACNMVRPLS